MPREKIIRYLVDLTKTSQIKSFRLYDNNGETVVNFQNINKFTFDHLLKNGTYISKSYVPLFLEKNFPVKFIFENLIENPRPHYVEAADRLLNFAFTNHSKIQFLKRFIIVGYLYRNENDFLSWYFKEEFDKSYRHLTELFIDCYKKSWYDSIYRDEVVENMMLNFMKLSKILDEKHLGRKKDKKLIRHRNEKHDSNTLRMTSHPLVFIFNSDNSLVTSELYSSCKDMRGLNRISSDNRKFYGWLLNHPGVIEKRNDTREGE